MAEKSNADDLQEAAGSIRANLPSQQGNDQSENWSDIRSGRIKIPHTKPAGASRGWVRFDINAGVTGSEKPHRASLKFADTTSPNAAEFNAFIASLGQNGFNGQVAIQSSRAASSASSPKLLVEARTADDMRIATAAAQSRFAGKASISQSQSSETARPGATTPRTASQFTTPEVLAAARRDASTRASSASRPGDRSKASTADVLASARRANASMLANPPPATGVASPPSATADQPPAPTAVPVTTEAADIEAVKRPPQESPAAPTAYQTLGVSPDAPQEAVRQAYRNKWNDKSLGDEERRSVLEAWKQVYTPNRRKAYDESLTAQRPQDAATQPQPTAQPQPAVQPPSVPLATDTGTQKPSETTAQGSPADATPATPAPPTSSPSPTPQTQTGPDRGSPPPPPTTPTAEVPPTPRETARPEPEATPQTQTGPDRGSPPPPPTTPAAAPADDDEPIHSWRANYRRRRDQQQWNMGPLRAAAYATFDTINERRYRDEDARGDRTESGRAASLDREAQLAGGTTAPPHPLVEAAGRALASDQELANQNRQQFMAAQTSDEGLPPTLQSPEAYYAATRLGYRPGDRRAPSAAGRRDRSDDPGLQWRDLGDVPVEARESAAAQLQDTREIIRDDQQIPPEREALARALRRNENLTAADAFVIQQRQEHGAPVSATQPERQQAWGQRMFAASRDALQQMPIVGRLFYQMDQMQNAMAKAAPLLAERHPMLANALFGEAAASGAAGAPLGGVAGVAAGAAGTIAAGILATKYASYKGQQAAQAGAEATSPFIGNANADVMGDMGQSAARALTGTSSELIMLPRRIRDWSKALLESNFTLKEWSADIAKIAFQSEIREIIRGQRSGAATAESLENLSNEHQNVLDFWQPTKDRITNFLAEKLTNAERKLRGLTDEEKAVLETPGWREMHDRQRKSLTWKERNFGLSAERKAELAKEQLDYVREHAETPSDVSYRGMENWMRMWQDGRMMQHQSQRPAPRGI